MDLLVIQAEVIEPSAEQDAALRVANDQPVLGTLLAAQGGEGASYRIAGDKDLLALVDRYPIVTPAAFWAVHGGLARSWATGSAICFRNENKNEKVSYRLIGVILCYELNDSFFMIFSP